MYPVLLEWGSIIVPTWHVFFVISLFFSYLSFHRLALILYPQVLLRKKLDLFFMISYVTGLFGARIFSIFAKEFPSSPEDLFSKLIEFGDMTFFGGILGGAFAGYLVCKVKKIPILALLDAALPSVLLGLAIGRIGCFLNGDDYGIPIDAVSQPWWSVTFPNHPIPVPRYPVQLMESGYGFICFLGLFFFFSKKKLHRGNLACISALSYALFRFFIEYLRGDDRGWVIKDVLSPAQFVCLVITTIVLAFFGRRYYARSLL